MCDCKQSGDDVNRRLFQLFHSLLGERNGRHRSMRYSVFGPLDIAQYAIFLKEGKRFFEENYKNPIIKKKELKDFEQIELLGKGSFGRVILVQDIKNERPKYHAMKVIEKERIVKSKQIEHTKNEKLILYSLNHPLTIHMDYFFKDNSYIYFIMPYIPGRELFGHLKHFGKFGEIQSRFYVAQIVLAIEYVHYLGLVYRDLKPENILIDHTGYLKLGDFGFCKLLLKPRTYTLCGTPEYLAPEIILNKGYGQSVDWWAVGVLIYELSAGYSPFYNKNSIKMYNAVIANKYKMPKHFSDDLRDIVKNILKVDLSRRYGNLRNGVEDIKQHRWFKTINWLVLLNRKMQVPYKPKYDKPGQCPLAAHFEKLVPSEFDRYASLFSDF